MNKLLIVLLAVCLVSVHAFVKRDAPAAPGDSDALKNFQKEFEELGKKISSQIPTIDSEQIKTGLNDIIDKISKAVNDLSKKDTPK